MKPLLSTLGLMAFMLSLPLAAWAVTASNVITWSPLSGVTSYTLEVSVNGGAYTTLVTGLGSGVTSYQDPTNRALGGTYCYQGFGVNAFGPGATSVPVCTTPNTPGQFVINSVVSNPVP